MEEEILRSNSFEEIIMILGSFATDKKVGTTALMRRFAGPISQL